MRTAASILLLVFAGCAPEAPQALGTLEYDRITLPAPAAERIVAIHVREGEQVAAGTRVLTLERTRGEAQARALRADAQRQREVLAELVAGARGEEIAQARAHLDAARAQAREARAYHARLQPLGRARLVAAADVDRARAAAGHADAQVRMARAALDALSNGTRRERIAQGESAVHAAEARLAAQRASVDELEVVAPRAGRIDSLPYEPGDQAPVGAPLAILLVGDRPHARIHVPEPVRANVKVGDACRVFVDGRPGVMRGRVRMIRSEPSFTPYYALIGEDAARLSYLAEIELGEDARDLPAGLPVRVEFGPDR